MLLFEAVVGVAAKIASASTIAQATAGLGIAVAGVTGAGAAGVLPGPVQDSVAAAVQAVTPFELPHSADRDPAAVRSPEPARPAEATPAGPTHDPSAVSPTAVPSATPEAEDHGAEAEDGTHQHRGGRTTSTATGVDDSDDATASDHHAGSGAAPTTGTETEDHHGGTAATGSSSGSGSSGSGSSGSGSSGSGSTGSGSGRHGG